MKLLLIVLLIAPAILCGNPLTESRNAKALKNLEDRLYAGVKEYIATGVETRDFKEALKLAKAPYVFRNLEENKNKPIVCVLCNVLARLLLDYKHSGVDIFDVKEAAKQICWKTGIESETVCNGVIELNIGIFVYIMDNKPDLTPDTICSVIAQPSGCPVPPEDDNWEVSIPPVADNFALRKTNEEPQKPIRILHVTDIHFDEYYKVGANAKCGEPLCCAANQGEPATPEDAAGNWGDYRNCDMPWYSVEMLMEQLLTHKDIDYIYYTGDIINHRVWMTSIKDNIKNIKQLYAKFRESFTETPVFPILGNHEPNPLNEFAPTNVTEDELTTKWLYNTVADEWKNWLPDSAQETVKKGGFYTVLVRPGFRIIALNSNVAYTFNWWLLYDHSILKEQLQWLSDTLAEAEKNHEIVHIISHVPTGDTTCLIKWSHEYKKLIKRFSHLIAAQFVGHTHYDEMNLFFNDNNIEEPISVVYNGGSFTTFVNVNPNYVIYEVNPQTMQVENYDLWIYNVTEANKNTIDVTPDWFKLYSFKEAYGLETMKLDELAGLVKRMSTNQTLLDQYYRFKMRAGDIAMDLGCDQACHEHNLCNLVLTQHGDTKVCDELIAAYRATLTKN